MNNFSYIVTPFLRPTLACACGSSLVSKRYVYDYRGEVEGQSLSCTSCGNFDSGR